MKDHITKTQQMIALFLWGLVIALFCVGTLAILESDVLIHGGSASGWYVDMLKSIGIRHFTQQRP